MVMILADFISKVEISFLLCRYHTKMWILQKLPPLSSLNNFFGDYITVMMIGGVLIIVIIVVDEGVFSSIEDI